MQDDKEIKQILAQVEDVVDARLKKAEATTLVSNGKIDWLHISVLVGFTITNVICLFAHGKLAVALTKLDHLESLISTASSLIK